MESPSVQQNRKTNPPPGLFTFPIPDDERMSLGATLGSLIAITSPVAMVVAAWYFLPRSVGGAIAQGSIFGTLATTWMVISEFRKRPEGAKVEREHILTLLTAIPVGILLGTILRFLFFPLDWLLGLVVNESTGFVLFSALAAGVVLFTFRLKRRATYGLTEVMAGLYVGVQRAEEFLAPGHSETSASNFAIAMLCTSVYLIVRGMDNVHQGFETDTWMRGAVVRVGWGLFRKQIMAHASEAARLRRTSRSVPPKKKAS